MMLLYCILYCITVLQSYLFLSHYRCVTLGMRPVAASRPTLTPSWCCSFSSRETHQLSLCCKRYKWDVYKNKLRKRFKLYTFNSNLSSPHLLNFWMLLNAWAGLLHLFSVGMLSHLRTVLYLDIYYISKRTNPNVSNYNVLILPFTLQILNFSQLFVCCRFMMERRSRKC